MNKSAMRQAIAIRSPAKVNAAKVIRQPLILFAIMLAQFASVAGQSEISECKGENNSPLIGYFAWPVAAKVKVYFVREMFTEEQGQALLRAMSLWSTAARENGAEVTFTYAGAADGPLDCDSCLTITRQQVNKNNRKFYAYFYRLGVRPDGMLKSAWIALDYATTAPKALQGFMAHELGHGMGLSDCLNCKKQTIMRGFTNINKDNGLIAPSVCDLEVVRELYQRQKFLQSRGATPAAAMRLATYNPKPN